MPTHCRVPNCPRKTHGYRICYRYYPMVQRIVDNADVRDGCWNWLAYRDIHGYGKIGMGKKVYLAHRLFYELLYGEVGDLSIDHLCFNTSCVRPDHLEAVPIGVNVLRGYSAPSINSRKTQCYQGHAFDELNTMTIHRSDGTVERACRTCKRLNRRRTGSAKNGLAET